MYDFHYMLGQMMGIHLITLFLIWLVIFGAPVMQILHRTGHSRWWLLITLVPVVNLVFLWIFAFSRWPIDNRAQ